MCQEVVPESQHAQKQDPFNWENLNVIQPSWLQWIAPVLFCCAVKMSAVIKGLFSHNMFLFCGCILCFLFIVAGCSLRMDRLTSSRFRMAGSSARLNVLMCNLPLFYSCLISAHRHTSTMLQLIATSQQAAVWSRVFIQVFIPTFMES